MNNIQFCLPQGCNSLAASEGECPQHCARSEQVGSASRQLGIIGMEHRQRGNGQARRGIPSNSLVCKGAS